MLIAPPAGISGEAVTGRPFAPRDLPGPPAIEPANQFVHFDDGSPEQMLQESRPFRFGIPAVGERIGVAFGEHRHSDEGLPQAGMEGGGQLLRLVRRMEE